MNDFLLAVQEYVNITLTPKQLSNLAIYELALVEWNTRINLTAVDEPEMIRTKHFLDSLTCYQVMQDTPMERVIDLGTGAGFPGLPLKIIFPRMRLTLVDSVRKKTDFCQYIVDQIGLTEVEIIQDRAENIGQNAAHREKYDWAVARAVAIMPILMEFLLPLAAIGGKVLAMKGENAPAETQNAENAIKVLGGHIQNLMPVSLPGVADQRYLVVVDKVAATPQKYPRRVGAPAKKPLLK
jgi:16S rRNA (guanine527-N7)-methyltransferase